MPRVSILTPTYNHAGYIRECIDSVLAQTFSNWEMLIIDDGSTDSTKEIVEAYDDPRIRFFQKENGGIDRLVEVYNLALANARGDLLAILEGDDHWPSDKLALQVPEFDDLNVVLVSGFTQVVDDERNDRGRIPNRLMSEEIRNNRPVGVATRAMLDPDVLFFTFPVATMLRKSAVERIGGFIQPKGMPVVDYPTILSVSIEGEFRFVPSPCGYWRRHLESATKSRYPDILDGCYGEAIRIAHEERSRLSLSDNDLNVIEAKWEDFQAFRCTLLGRMLAKAGRLKDAARAFRMGNQYHRSPRSRALANLAASMCSLGIPVELMFKVECRLFAQRNNPGDARVRLTDLDRPWPIYRY